MTPPLWNKRALVISALVFAVGVLIYIGREKIDESAANSEAAPPIPTQTVSPVPPGQSPGLYESSQVPAAEAEQSLLAALSSAREGLAKKAQMKAKTESEVHHTPIEVVESARRIGAISELLEKSPALIPQALPFFVECAKDPEGMPATRALCVYRLRSYEKNWDGSTTAAFAKIPKPILELAEKLGD